MTSADWDAAAGPGRQVGHAIEFHRSIGSTNDRAWELLRAGRAGIAVVADLQTAGRGRHGRTWASPPGVNLLVSIGARTDLAPEDAWRLAAAAALALLEACRPVVARAGATLEIRWPNDVVDARGDKVAGLLAETAIVGDRVRDVVIGAGLNVNWRRAEMPAEIAARATSLCELASTEIDRVGLLAGYLRALDGELAAVEAGRSPVERFRAAATWLTGRQVEVSTGKPASVGVVAGIGDDGSLMLETDRGLVSLGYGEVTRVGVVAEQVPA